MTRLIASGIVATTLLVAAYIIGSELCLPAARRALRVHKAQPLLLASRLVVMGEWALIGAVATLLAIAQELWHPFTGSPVAVLLGVAAVFALAGAVFWELSGRMWKNRGIVMSLSLDLVLPPHGERRVIYERTHHLLETGSRPERESALNGLLR